MEKVGLKMFKTRPIKVLWHGEFGVSTGFGGVSENIVDRLNNIRTEWGTQKYAPAVMALGKGMNPFDNSNRKPYPVIPMYGNQQAAPFGHDYAADLVRRYRPDVIVTFGDTWMVDFWNEPGIVPEDLRSKLKVITYVAIDGYPVPDFWIDKYRKFDKVVTYTKFGKDAIDERAKKMGQKVNTDFIHHGVNTQAFKPLSQTDIDGFKEQNGLKGKKIVGMFSRNQPRKHHPEFIEFAQALLRATNNDPNLMFYIHAVENDAGWNLPALIRDLDEMKLRDRFLLHGTVGPNQEIPSDSRELQNRFFFPGIKNPAEGIPVEHLNMMYNICDVHVMLTSGEGFGCTVLESLAAGVPTLTNDYAASAELISMSGGGELIKAREYTYRGSDHNFYRPHTDHNDAVEKTIKILNDPELAKKYKKKARAFGLQMSWDVIIEDWDRVISSVFEVDSNEVVKTELI